MFSVNKSNNRKKELNEIKLNKYFKPLTDTGEPKKVNKS